MAVRRYDETTFEIRLLAIWRARPKHQSNARRFHNTRENHARFGEEQVEFIGKPTIQNLDEVPVEVSAYLSKLSSI
jgi:hypothetical protein